MIINGTLINNGNLYSGFSANDFFILNHSIPESNNIEFISKVMLIDTHSTRNDVLGFSIANSPVGFESTRALGMFNTSKWVLGSVIYPLNEFVWVKFTWDGSTYTVYGMSDDNYDIYNLPNNWNLEATWSTTTKLWSSPTIRIGNTVKTTTEYFGGYIDIENTILNVNSHIYWSGLQGLYI